MKKILLSLATVLCASAFASANEVTFTFYDAATETTNTYGLTPEYNTTTPNNTEYLADNATVTEGDITLTLGGGEGCWRNWADGTRAYGKKKSPTLKVSGATTGITITGISIKLKTAVTIQADNGKMDKTTSVSQNSWTGNASDVTFTITGANSAIQVLTITYTPAGGVVVDAPQFSVEGGKYFEAQTVEITAGAGSTIYYTTDGATPTDDVNDGSSIKYTEPITISTTTTLKAIAFDADDNKSSVTTATYTISKLLEGAEGDGTEANPFNVAAAHNAANQGSTATVYVKGYITQIDEVSTDYGNATYSINDDATYDAASALVIFRGYYGNDGTNNIKFTAADQIAVGNLVVLYGKLKDYSGTMELEKSYIVTLDGNTTGVEAIENDANAPVEYFNLQGVRVDNPANGLYIMRQGSKVVKVVK